MLVRHFKQISRMFMTGSDGYPTLDNCLGQISSTGISAALGVHDHAPVVAAVYMKMHLTFDLHLL